MFIDRKEERGVFSFFYMLRRQGQLKKRYIPVVRHICNEAVTWLVDGSFFLSMGLQLSKFLQNVPIIG